MSFWSLITFSYLRRLHFSLKKGRWSAEEEAQLMELIEKHGVGEHWGQPPFPEGLQHFGA
jgi:hypothetical protein